MKELKIDKHDIEIRRIREEDENGKFVTTNKNFDKVNPSGTLKEYFESERENNFLVYFIKNIKYDKVLGLIRIRYEFDEIKDSNAKVFLTPPSIYISRFGVIKECQHLFIYEILRYFLYHIFKTEIKELKTEWKELWMYLKCPKKDIKYYQKVNKFELFKEYFDSEWNEEAGIMGRRLY